jgi:hypothetical protein
MSRLNGNYEVKIKAQGANGESGWKIHLFIKRLVGGNITTKRR